MSLVCSAPWNGLFIWTDGTASYCGRTRAKGDLVRQSFEEFWNSDAVQRARSHFLKGAHIESGCPPTCCWLTAKAPEKYIAAFDNSKGADAVVEDEIFFTHSKRPRVDSYISNLESINTEISDQNLDVGSFPTSLSISLTDYCSLRCPMCCFGIIPAHRKKSVAKIIPSTVLDKIKDIYPFINRLDLIGGELFDIPFEINPLVRVLNDIKETKASNIRVTLTTNGQHLTERWVEFLLDFTCIDIVAFSVDSFDPLIYANTRVNGSLDRVRRSINLLKQIKAKKNTLFPVIKLNSILGVHTHREVSNFIDNAVMLGVSEVEFQKLVLMGDPDFFAKNNLFQPQHIEKLVRVWRDLASIEFPSNASSIIGMVEAYLNHRGVRDSLIFSDKTIPSNAHYENDYYAPPIVSKNTISQKFVARRETISILKLFFGTYMRKNTSHVNIIISKNHQAITQSYLDTTDLADNRWSLVELPSARLVVGDEYQLTLSAANDVRSDNCITVALAKAGDGLSINGVAQKGSMSYLIY